MSNIAVDSNVNAIGVPPTTHVTVSIVTLNIGGSFPHEVQIIGQFSVDCTGGTGGIVVANIVIDGHLALTHKLIIWRATRELFSHSRGLSP